MNFKTPLLQLGDVLITSIQTDLSDAQVSEFQQDLVRAIGVKNANAVVIDISALDVVDSFMARVINDTARAARLVGAEVAVCGIQPYVAMTLVEMGRQLFDVQTTFNLEQALAAVKAAVDVRL
ncbi:STAS domain-containing protein [Catenovulum sediminis]|uniref:STAS domain-containing protein n=1 Tax=Catenovulum sediminis TaxID=1740262 RepID=UPI001180E555|nr:STAS domain-containing protein [Catenovulum sediminis]